MFVCLFVPTDTFTGKTTNNKTTGASLFNLIVMIFNKTNGKNTVSLKFVPSLFSIFTFFKGHAVGQFGACGRV